MLNHKKIFIVLLVIFAIALPFGIHWYVGYEARHFGREAADEAVSRANRANFAENEWNKLLRLARDEDFRTLIEQQLAEQCIDANYIVSLMIQSQYGETDSELANILTELLPEPASPEECAASIGDNQEAQPDGSEQDTTTTITSSADN